MVEHHTDTLPYFSKLGRGVLSIVVGVEAIKKA
jgi:hypothetical protein